MSQRIMISGDFITISNLLKLRTTNPQHIYDINGLKFVANAVCSEGYEHYGSEFPKISVELYQVKEKSQEEIAAEEAVRKAKESLKAAEEVLNKVKKGN